MRARLAGIGARVDTGPRWSTQGLSPAESPIPRARASCIKERVCYEEDILSTRILVASSRQEGLAGAWEAVPDSFGQHAVPSTLLGVTVLGYKDQPLEIEAVAAVLDS